MTCFDDEAVSKCEKSYMKGAHDAKIAIYARKERMEGVLCNNLVKHLYSLGKRRRIIAKCVQKGLHF